MRLVPIITAILVSVGLYFLIIERDRLFAFAADTPLADEEEVVAEAPEALPEEIEAEVTGADAIRVVAITSTAQPIQNGVVLRGRTEAARQVTVAAETSGAVVSEPLRRGSFVEEGDLLCQLDPGTRQSNLAEARARLNEAEGRVPEAEASVAEAEARIRSAEVEVNAARQLSEGGFASETRLTSAEAALEGAEAARQRAQTSVTSAQAGIEAARAAVAAAERELTRLEITAPFAGLLETDTAELGSLMQPGTPCATIVQLDPIKLVGFVTEADVGKIELGAPAAARLVDGTTLEGEVTFISRSADESTRTFRVDVTVANPDLSVGAGQTAEILVSAEGREAHLIPQSALTLDDEGRLGVRTIGADKVSTFMPVTLVRDTIDGAWATDLPETVDIIVIGQEFVTDGVVVEPTYREAAG